MVTDVSAYVFAKVGSTVGHLRLRTAKRPTDPRDGKTDTVQPAKPLDDSSYTTYYARDKKFDHPQPSEPPTDFAYPNRVLFVYQISNRPTGHPTEPARSIRYSRHIPVRALGRPHNAPDVCQPHIYKPARTCTQKRLRGQASSAAESIAAQAQFFSLNIGSCTANFGYARLKCVGSGRGRAPKSCSGLWPVSHVFRDILIYFVTRTSLSKLISTLKATAAVMAALSRATYKS